MTAYTKVGGEWKEFDPNVKVGGSWYPVDNGYVKVGGVWKDFYALSEPVIELLLPLELIQQLQPPPPMAPLGRKGHCLCLLVGEKWLRAMAPLLLWDMVP